MREVEQPVDAAARGRSRGSARKRSSLITRRCVAAPTSPGRLVHAHAYTHTRVALLTRGAVAYRRERAVFATRPPSIRRAELVADPAESGVVRKLRPLEDRLTRGLDRVAGRRRRSPSRRGPPPSDSIRARDRVGLRAQRLRERRDLLGGAAAHRVHRARQHRRVGLRVWGAERRAPASGRQRGEGRTASSRARRRRGSSRGRAPPRSRSAGRLVERRGDQLRAAQRRDRATRGWRAACRAPRRRARARSSRWREGGGRRSVVIANGSAITSAGRTRCRAYASRPVGRRWMPRHLGPDSVVGMRGNPPPRTAAIAFATSITRPPPSATRARPATWSTSPPRARPPAPGWTSCTRVAQARARSSGAAPSARGVVRSSKPSHPCEPRISPASSKAPGAEDDRPLAVAPGELTLSDPPEPGAGIEPAASALQRPCSPVELPGQFVILAQRIAVLGHSEGVRHGEACG